MNRTVAARILVVAFPFFTAIAYIVGTGHPVTKLVTSEKPTVASLLQAVNEERTKVGVAPLVLDDRLNKSAQVKADDMVARNYFAHESPDGKHGYAIAREYASDCKSVSENILDDINEQNFVTEGSVQAWKTSPAHYTAMVDPKYSLTGFGISGFKIVEHFCEQKTLEYNGAICNDGRQSYSSGPGTCSGHGGVNHFV